MTSRHGAHRRDDFAGRRVLEQEPAGAGAQGIDDVLVETERRQDQDALSWQPAGRLDAVHAGHANVHQDDVGGVLCGGADGLLPRAGLAYNLDVAGRLEDGLEACAHHRLIVGDDDAQRGHGLGSAYGSIAVTLKP